MCPHAGRDTEWYLNSYKTDEVERARAVFVSLLGEIQSCQGMVDRFKEDVFTEYRRAVLALLGEEVVVFSALDEGEQRRLAMLRGSFDSCVEDALNGYAGAWRNFPRDPPALPDSSVDDATRVAEAIIKWSREHGGERDWFQERMVQVCCRWYNEPGRERENNTHPFECVHLDFGSPRVHFTQKGWVQTAESWQTFKMNTVKAFRNYLQKDYHRAIDVVPLARRRTPELRDHLAWLVRSRFGGESHAEIAKHVKRARPTVSEGIRNKDRLIGLTIPVEIDFIPRRGPR